MFLFFLDGIDSGDEWVLVRIDLVWRYGCLRIYKCVYFINFMLLILCASCFCWTSYIRKNREVISRECVITKHSSDCIKGWPSQLSPPELLETKLW